ncbi:FtsW/RodA/SpoVE family cell cycle protein [Exiguobacterium sp.]|uniref:FtsW/RodA/SpoVE family cell cycle protein n=1 Tax=Exiguobacterium sp. TaxID=44751 RepID=UPI00391C9694
MWSHLKLIWLKMDTTLLSLLALFMLISVWVLSAVQAILPVTIANVPFPQQQIVWYIIGFVALVAVLYVEFDQLQKLHWWLYGLGVGLLLLLVPLQGTSFVPNINGAYRWIQVAGVTIQPSELMKIFLTLTLASMAATYARRPRQGREDLWFIGKTCLVTFVPFVLVFTQPDLGSGLVLLMIFLAILFVSEIDWKWAIGALGFVAASIAGFFYLFLNHISLVERVVPGHSLNRVYAWLDPYSYASDLSYQLMRSMNKIGAGQITGVGRNNPLVSLPEAHTDFIFASLAGFYGFFGATTVILLYFFFIAYTLRMSRRADSWFGTYFIIGMIAMFGFQVFQNIGMTIGVLPITGLPLPFLSYGGTSLVVSLFAVGLMMNAAHKTYVRRDIQKI